MGTVSFVQSRNDFPCTVRLGEDGKRFEPRFALSRWGRADVLSIDPEEADGGVLRGDRRRLLYAGARRSHRFTILDGKRFEYDVILHREPETNTVALSLDYPGKLSFYRQPDFLQGDLAGSYAVYGDNMNGPFGTGKLCHIYRPKIIDARGRRVYGDLSIGGKTLTITIPEQWLAGAAYPVVVDPIFGMQTEGSTCMNYEYVRHFECCIPVNRSFTPVRCIGPCTAHFYTHSEAGLPCGGYPAIYSDVGGKPTSLLTTSESFIDMNNIPLMSPEWVTGTFDIADELTANTNFWFGIHPKYNYYPWFDYGVTCWAEYPQYDLDEVFPIPNYGPVGATSSNYNIQISMYFECVASTRYFSYPKEVAKTTTALQPVMALRRKKAEYSHNTSTALPRSDRLRSACETLASYTTNTKRIGFARYLNGILEGVDRGPTAGYLFKQLIAAAVAVQDVCARRLLIVVLIATGHRIRDYVLTRFVKSREVIELHSRITREIELRSRI